MAPIYVAANKASPNGKYRLNLFHTRPCENNIKLEFYS